MDWLRRRQIGARPFLRPAQFQFRHNWNSNSVWIGAGERGKRHEFNVGDIHGTATGNLFFLLLGTGGISSFIISCSIWSLSLFERGSNREGLCWRVKQRRSSRESVDSPVDAELEIGWSSLDGDWLPVIRDVFVWQLQLPLDSFYGFHVGGGNCGLTLRILFWLSVKLFFL